MQGTLRPGQAEKRLLSLASFKLQWGGGGGLSRGVTAPLLWNTFITTAVFLQMLFRCCKNSGAGRQEREV